MIRAVLRSPNREEPTEVRLQRVDPKSAGAFMACVDVHRVEIEINGSGSSGTLRNGGRVNLFRWWTKDDHIDLWIAGRIYTFKIVRRTARRAGDANAAALAGDLMAPMPGTVLKINVQQGDSFEAQQPLVVLESMKMEMSLSSPRPGRVVEVKCKVGELVNLGALLVSLEEA